MPIQTNKSLHLNNSSKPLLFIGSNSDIHQYAEACEQHGIEIAGIIDSDYFGNQAKYCDIPVVGSEKEFDDPTKLQYYKDNFNFFCATNWVPGSDPITVRNTAKRHMLLDLIDQFDIPCISLVEKTAIVSSSAIIGKSCYIGHMVILEPKVIISDFVTIQAQSLVAQRSLISKNCVLQRFVGFPADSIMEENVFLSSLVRIGKPGITLGKGTFVTENIYLRRGTIAEEIVSVDGGNTKRVYHHLVE